MDQNALNGFGKRLNDTEKEVVRVDTLTNRNTSDIEKVFKLLATLPYKVMFMISIPTLLIIIQMIITYKNGR